MFNSDISLNDPEFDMPSCGSWYSLLKLMLL